MLVSRGRPRARGAGVSVTTKTPRGQAASLLEIVIGAGTKADRHSHSFEQFVQVIAGRRVLETEEGRQPLPLPARSLACRDVEEDTVLVETNLA